jgi:hypothetical protein
MPVQRFRDFDQARRALWAEPGDPRLPGRIRALWHRAARLAAPAIPRGLRKFRCIDEATQERDAWVERRIAMLRADRDRSGRETH